MKNIIRCHAEKKKKKISQQNSTAGMPIPNSQTEGRLGSHENAVDLTKSYKHTYIHTSEANKSVLKND